MLVNRKTLIFSSALVGLLLFCIITTNQEYWLNWLGIAIFFYAVMTWHWEKNDKIFSLYAIFFLFLLLFHYGDCIMWALGIDQDSGLTVGKLLVYGSNLYMSKKDLVDTKWYICLSMLAFHIGALLFVKRKSTYVNGVDDIALQINVDKNKLDRSALYKAGCIVTAIVAPITIGLRISEVIIARQYGYSALYYSDMSTQSGYVQIIIYLFFPGLIALLIGSDFSKKVVRTVVIIFGIYMCLGIASGDRGNWLYSLIILIWIFHQRKPARISTVIKLIVIGVIGIYLLQIVTLSRNYGGLSDLSLESFTEALSLDNSPIVDAFFEMGGSMGIVTIFLKLGAVYPYANTYLTAILGAVSSRFLSFWGIDFVLLADWLSQEYFNLNYGLGFSMIAEAYVNGGYIGGLIYMCILGAIIGKLLAMCRDSWDMQNNPVKAFISISSTNLLMSLPRGAVYLVVKNFVYGVVLMLLLIYLLKMIARKDMKIS